MRLIAVNKNGLKTSDLLETKLDWKSIDQFAAQTEFVGDLTSLYQFGSSRKIDFLPVIQTAKPKLALFDMDSTLVNGEVINELAKIKKCEKDIAEITRRAMNGELDFAQSLTMRLSYLDQIPFKSLEEIHYRLLPNLGARELIWGLKHMGIKTYIASGGFDFFASKLCLDLGMDGQFSNTLEIKNGMTTGQITGEVVDAKKKRDILEMKARELGISMSETIAVGDGANDLEMIHASGFGIAYHAKPIVKEQSPIQLNYNPLDALLYLWK